MEQIHKILLQAIEGESGAEAQYKAFSARASAEGYPKVASLFTALAQAEAVHIANHLRALEKNGYSEPLPKFDLSCEVKTTRINLEKAITAEYEEFQKRYPSFRRQIGKKYGGQFAAKIALLSISWAAESEANHHELLQDALRAVALERDVGGGDYYLCSVCGNIIFTAEQPEKLCDVCGHDVSFYTLMRDEHDSL